MKKALQFVAHWAGVIWRVDAVQSVVITRLIQAGMSSTIAGVVVAVANAVANGGS